MKRRVICLWLASLASVFVSGSALAQMGGFGGGPSPAMKARFEKVRRKMATDARAKLTLTLYQLHEIDRDPATRLTPAQAARIDPILHAWREKPSMTDEEAKAVAKQISAPLTMAQIKKLATIKSPWARGGAGRGTWGGGFGGGNGWSGAGGRAGRGWSRTLA